MYQQLKDSGLTDNEVKVYLALVNNGANLAGRISRLTGLHRRTVYDITEMLIQKGLIGYMLKNNRRIFSATNPNKLLENLQEKEALLLPIVHELKQKLDEKKEKEETLFYKGKQALKNIFEDQLNSKEILILGANSQAYNTLQFYFKWYDQKRKKNKIKTRIITHDKKIKRIPLAEIRYIEEKYSNPLAINIYKDKVAIILWAKEPIAILIKNKEIADSYKLYFELMWKTANN
ncbi:MAG: helix-turn-helix domain-containing protein [Nanoarchaeota archaeon]